jgi:CheY-like chemotaxis protein
MPGYLTHRVQEAAHMPGPLRCAPQREQASRSAFIARQSPAILAVDDEPSALEILHALFEDEGFSFVHATSAAQALQALEADVPDLFIVDYMMPGMSGIELCEYLRAAPKTRDIPIILYSGYTIPPAYRNRGLYDRVLMKPADPEQLLSVVNELVPRQHG